MTPFEDAFRRAIAEAVDLDEADLGPVDEPPDPGMGDLAYACFPLASELRRAPREIAADLAERVELDERFAGVEAAGPYLNARVDPEALSREVLGRIRSEGDAYGTSDLGEGRRMVFDYSSPNLAKPFGIGHLRSTVIGRSLVRIHRALGWEPVGVNHIGDWGTQFGFMATAWERWGSEEELAANPVEHLYDLYQRIHREEARLDEEDPEGPNPVREEARAFFRRMEEGDDDALALHARFRDLSLEEFRAIYDRLGVSFDSWAGESFYEDRMDETVDLLREKGLLEESEGATIVDFGSHGIDLEPPLMVLKSDGSTTYATRDLCAAIYRAEHYGAHGLVYVVGHPQTLHFRQVFATLELCGFEWAERCVHVEFGHILGMSTRKGTLVFLQDVLDTAVEKARAIIEEKNPDLEEVERVAEAVGVGAVVFHDLKHNRTRDIEFAWDRVVAFEGETGPYLQNAHVRLCGILRKWAAEGGERAAEIAHEVLDEPATRELLKLMGRYPETVRRAGGEHEPSVVSRYLLDLASALHSWYHDHPVATADDPEVRAARVELVHGLRHILAHGLRLLGVEPLERM